MSRSLLVLSASSLLILGLLGCQGAPKGEGSTSTGTTASRVEISPVVWPKKEQLDKATLETLSEESRRKVAVSTVPVLVPSDPKLLAVGMVMAEEVWFAFNASADGITVSVHGTRLAHKYDDIPKTPGTTPMRGTKGLVTENERIRGTSWNENGVAYTVDLECASATDARCQSDKHVLEITDGLRYVGGAGQ